MIDAGTILHLIVSVHFQYFLLFLLISLSTFSTPQNCDGGLYVGAAGVAYTLWYLSTKAAFASQKDALLGLAKKYVDVCFQYIQHPQYKDDGIQVKATVEASIALVLILIKNFLYGKTPLTQFSLSTNLRRFH